MQQALPYRDWLTTATGGEGRSVAASPANANSGRDLMIGDDAGSARKLVAENAVVVFARRGCCMCHVVKLLLHGHGVNPSIVDVDEQNEAELASELSRIVGNESAVPQFPAVFVGGELFGGLEDIMGAHISGELVPRLREARALWL